MSSFTGTAVSFLGRIKPDVFIPTVPLPNSPLRTTPAFAGSVEDFITSNKLGTGDDAAKQGNTTSRVSSMLLNKVKKCEECHKPNGFTLSTCNSCGHSLQSTPISFTPNVFMGFAFGIEKAPFPLTISIRHQDEDILVFDDLLALSPLHLNVIPTDRYIPDWRYLLRRPREGLVLIDGMKRRCESVAKEQFLSEGSLWSRTFLRKRNREHETSGNEDRFDPAQHMCCGFNYPPSQSQLHLQYICPNVMPFQYAQFLNGVHFTQGRFFPMEYVRGCLELLIKHDEGHASSTDAQTRTATVRATANIPTELLHDDATVDSIIRFFSATYQHDYEVFHAMFLKRFADLAQTFSFYPSDWFEGLVVPSGERGRGRLIGLSDDAAVDEAIVIADVAAADKLRLQNYGRPYDKERGDRPSGSYYAFPKQPDTIDCW